MSSTFKKKKSTINLSKKKMQHIQGSINSINFAFPIEALFFNKKGLHLQIPRANCNTNLLPCNKCGGFLNNVLLRLLILSPPVQTFTQGMNVLQPRTPCLHLHSCGPKSLHERKIHNAG
ncbi:thyroid hormone receptor-associated protein 3 [Platysternon megacephalum]|uniref:Thyroid hormone receptor-associated protein 3 n=1 Tax=Platysternon megacephalum TaxID=55544 RepID=A0A4D9F7H3_9SAUR|nr:thyroid hormone receptor-associated protein 3 [Platysternon megacephalum]